MPCEDHGRRTTPAEAAEYAREQTRFQWKRDELKKRGINPGDLMHVSVSPREYESGVPSLEDARISNYRREALEQRLTLVTQLLCRLLNRISDSSKELLSALISNDAELSVWWEEHQEGDKQALVQQALSKLTPEERSALGL